MQKSDEKSVMLSAAHAPEVDMLSVVQRLADTHCFASAAVGNKIFDAKSTVLT